MRMKILAPKIAFLVMSSFWLFACGPQPVEVDDPTPKVGDKPVVLSRFNRAGYSDLLIDKSGTYHAVFQESGQIGGTVYVYYSKSTNKGKTWTEPVAISNDKTQNGAGQPHILQDGKGTIYAIWKRYGSSASQYPVKEITLDGPGGNVVGTVYFAVLNGDRFDNPIMLADEELLQYSWFPFIGPSGELRVMWAQRSAVSKKDRWEMWYFADYLRLATVSGGSVTGVSDITQPAGPSNPQGGAPPKNGWQNLSGYIDRAGKIRFIGELLVEGRMTLAYFDGISTKAIYQYPNNGGNTFMNPAVLTYDEAGNDHILLKPASTTPDDEMIWDINPVGNTYQPLAHVRKAGIKIQGFQAFQGPNGQMAVVVQAGGLVESNESFGVFYKDKQWTTIGLTANASKETFQVVQFWSINILPVSTYYDTDYVSVAWDNNNKRSLLMTLSATSLAGGYAVNKPSVIFSAID